MYLTGVNTERRHIQEQERIRVEISSCRQNSQLIKRVKYARILLVVIMIAASNFFCVNKIFAESDPFNDTIRILERWTSTHWGQDCFVWIVHYPEELINPWVEAEAVRAGLSESQQELYKENFISELQIDKSETFLVSIYSFGVKPVDLNPVRDNIALVLDSGERVKPVRFDASLENPSRGVIQGLIFFPKQIQKNYAISLKGIGRNERLFTFLPLETAPVIREPENKPELVVMNLPKREPIKKPAPPKKPTPPTPPVIPPRPIKPIFQEESSDMANFVKNMRSNNNNASQDNKPKNNNINNSRQLKNNTGSAYASRESVLRKFLSLWAQGSYSEMYEMLCTSSKKVISRDNFAKEAAKASDMRAALKGDFSIDWIGEERAKVVAVQKTLIFRSVVSRTLGVTREGSSWKIVW